jgi:tetratricopeptide (TPR) repeat protein
MIALAYWRSGQSDKARQHAARVLELAENISPTVYSINMGFSAIADVYFGLWEKALQDPRRRLDAEQLKVSTLKAIKLVRAYEKVFPIGQPGARYYEGCHAWLMGEKQKAVRLWEKGLEAAQKFNMIYEEGLIRLKLGAMESESARRAEHIGRAVEIFTRMGARHELQLAGLLQ